MNITLFSYELINGATKYILIYQYGPEIQDWSRFAEEKSFVFQFLSLLCKGQIIIYRVSFFISYYNQVKPAMDLYMDYTSCGIATTNHVFIEVQPFCTKFIQILKKKQKFGREVLFRTNFCMCDIVGVFRFQLICRD